MRLFEVALALLTRHVAPVAPDGAVTASAVHPAPPNDRWVDSVGASIFHLLGVDVTRVFHDFLGRPHRVCKGTPITELVGT